MNDPDTPDGRAESQTSIFARMQTFKRLSLTGRIRALVALSIFIFSPLAIIASFGVEISGLIPFWLSATMALLLLLVGPFIGDRWVNSAATSPKTTLENPSGLMWESINMATELLSWVFGLYVLLHWAATSFPWVLQSIVIGWFTLSGLAIAVTMSIENARRWIVRFLLKLEFGIFVTLTCITFEIVYMTILFGSLTFALQRHGLVLLHMTSGMRPTANDVIIFYLWYFLNAIPLLDITNAVHWVVPITYKGALTGVLLICYKALVIVPMIATLVLVLKGGSKAKE